MSGNRLRVMLDDSVTKTVSPELGSAVAAAIVSMDDDRARLLRAVEGHHWGRATSIASAAMYDDRARLLRAVEGHHWGRATSIASAEADPLADQPSRGRPQTSSPALTDRQERMFSALNQVVQSSLSATHSKPNNSDSETLRQIAESQRFISMKIDSIDKKISSGSPSLSMPSWKNDRRTLEDRVIELHKKYGDSRGVVTKKITPIIKCEFTDLPSAEVNISRAIHKIIEKHRGSDLQSQISPGRNKESRY